MTQATGYLYRQVIVLPGLKIRDIMRNLTNILFPRKIVALGRVLILVSLLVPFGMAVGVLPASFWLLGIALLTVAAGSMACLIGCTFYLGGDQALY